MAVYIGPWQWSGFVLLLMLQSCTQIKKTAYAQSSQIRQIRKKMVEIMTREASSCDLKELVGKFIPEAIGELTFLASILCSLACSWQVGQQSQNRCSHALLTNNPVHEGICATRPQQYCC